MKCQGKPAIDDYFYQLGYQLSLVLTIFGIGVLYGPLCPLVAIVCILFFGFKYYVDKYNLSFVYRNDF